MQATQLVQDGEAEEELLSLLHLGARQEHVMLNGTSVTMEIDTGAAISIMSSQQKVKEGFNLPMSSYAHTPRSPFPCQGLCQCKRFVGNKRRISTLWLSKAMVHIVRMRLAVPSAPRLEKYCVSGQGASQAVGNIG